MRILLIGINPLIADAPGHIVLNFKDNNLKIDFQQDAAN